MLAKNLFLFLLMTFFYPIPVDAGPTRDFTILVNTTDHRSVPKDSLVYHHLLRSYKNFLKDRVDYPYFELVFSSDDRYRQLHSSGDEEPSFFEKLGLFWRRLFPASPQTYKEILPSLQDRNFTFRSYISILKYENSLISKGFLVLGCYVSDEFVFKYDYSGGNLSEYEARKAGNFIGENLAKFDLNSPVFKKVPNCEEK